MLAHPHLHAPTHTAPHAGASRCAFGGIFICWLTSGSIGRSIYWQSTLAVHVSNCDSAHTLWYLPMAVPVCMSCDSLSQKCVVTAIFASRALVTAGAAICVGALLTHLQHVAADCVDTFAACICAHCQTRVERRRVVGEQTPHVTVGLLTSTDQTDAAVPRLATASRARVGPVRLGCGWEWPWGGWRWGNLWHVEGLPRPVHDVVCTWKRILMRSYILTPCLPGLKRLPRTSAVHGEIHVNAKVLVVRESHAAFSRGVLRESLRIYFCPRASHRRTRAFAAWTMASGCMSDGFRKRQDALVARVREPVAGEICVGVDAILPVAVADVDDVVCEHVVVATIVHFLGVGHEEKVAGDVVPAAAVVRIKPLGRTVVGNDQVLHHVVHRCRVAWFSSCDG
eukprot:m.82149 g.82149  ORF g.82149 m.82149 type:complete len:396 (-) comp16321_c0_seq1:2287-3474(-)